MATTRYAPLVGVLHAEVSQAADSLHADQRVGSDVETPQRVECGDAGAQERGRFQRFQLIGDADQNRWRGRRRPRRTRRLPWCPFCGWFFAVHEVTATTPITRSVVSAEVAQADAISDLPSADPVPDGVDDTTISWPGTIGWLGSARMPSTPSTSLWQTPQL